MKRWKYKLAAALLVFGSMTGCTRTLYMTTEDQKAVSLAGLPKNLETDPDVVAPPSWEGHDKPPTVDFPDRPIRYLTLSEAFAIALESGTRGQTSVASAFSNNQVNVTSGQGRNSFAYVDDLVAFAGRTVNGDDAIRAFALDPAVVGADIEGALAKFDARWLTQMTWNKVDTAVANTLNNFTNGDTAAFSTGLYKPLPTGGVTGITFNTNYTKLSAPPTGFAVINPAYQPALGVNFEQPLLRDYGIEINQLLPGHPGSTQIAGLTPSGGRAEGIVITRIRVEQQRLDFQRSVNIMLFNVENVYWGLYANYFSLYAAEQGLRQAYLTWQLRKSELEAGKATAHEVAQVRAQFAQFRTQRIQTLQQVLESERELRGLLGLPAGDGKRLVPADAPTLAPYDPDWYSSISEALASRPELIMARQDVKANQMNVMLQQNNTRPDLRFFGNYNVNSIGTQLDGSAPANALANLPKDKFNNWQAGLRLNVVLGTRDAHASLRTAQLNLARSYVVLKDQELKAEKFMTGVYQNLFSAYRQIETTREQRMALAEQLKGLYARIQAGKDSLITILTAQQQFAAALSGEHQAIANYNIAIAGMQYAKGTLMQYDNIMIADSPLPSQTMERAVDNMARRTAGHVARERAIGPNGNGPHPLPALLENQPPPPPADIEVAPAPRRMETSVSPPTRPVISQVSSKPPVQPIVTPSLKRNGGKMRLPSYPSRMSMRQKQTNSQVGLAANCRQPSNGMRRPACSIVRDEAARIRMEQLRSHAPNLGRLTIRCTTTVHLAYVTWPATVANGPGTFCCPMVQCAKQCWDGSQPPIS